MKKQLVIGLLIGLVLTGGAFAQDYVVGEGDVLEVTVYDNDDLATTARISTEGFITMPLIGQGGG